MFSFFQELNDDEKEAKKRAVDLKLQVQETRSCQGISLDDSSRMVLQNIKRVNISRAGSLSRSISGSGPSSGSLNFEDFTKELGLSMVSSQHNVSLHCLIHPQVQSSMLLALR